MLLCCSVALWNDRDPILKERMFGLTNSEGNHGEDVKEYYFYLDSTPTHSYAKTLYKYPQAAFPYDQILQETVRAEAARAVSRSKAIVQDDPEVVAAHDVAGSELPLGAQSKRERLDDRQAGFRSDPEQPVAVRVASRQVRQLCLVICQATKPETPTSRGRSATRNIRPAPQSTTTSSPGLIPDPRCSKFCSTRATAEMLQVSRSPPG